MLWEPPVIRGFVVATSGHFTPDAVAWVEKHNEVGKVPLIDLWAESRTGDAPVRTALAGSEVRTQIGPLQPLALCIADHWGVVGGRINDTRVSHDADAPTSESLANNGFMERGRAAG